MSILVELAISVDRFELGRFVSEYDSLVAELERVVPTESRAVPYVWVTGPPDSLDELAGTFASSPMITDSTVLDELAVSGANEEQHLFRLEWDVEDLDIVKGIIGADGAILEGESMDGYWHLVFRFSDHQDVADFYQYLTDNGITDFDIHSIYELTSRSDRNGGNDLTDEQRETLIAAARNGYFDIPRGVTLDDLGEELGISQQAASQRIRRAVGTVVFDALNLPDGTHPN
jgi:predicted DNA binding protein